MSDKVIIEGAGDMIDPINKTAIFAFGRFQPPTLEVEKIINTIEKTIRDLRGEADGYIFISDTVNEEHSKLKKKKLVKEIQSGMEFYKEYADKQSIRNPLSATFRTYLMKTMFKDTNVKIINGDICMDNYASKCNNYLPIIKILEDNSYEKIYIVIPEEKLETLEPILERKNNIRSITGKPPIELITVSGYKSLEIEIRDAALRNDKRFIEKEMILYEDDNINQPNLLDADIEYLITQLVLGSGLEHDHANMDSVGYSSYIPSSPRSLLDLPTEPVIPDFDIKLDDKAQQRIDARRRELARKTAKRQSKTRKNRLAEKRGLRGGRKLKRKTKKVEKRNTKLNKKQMTKKYVRKNSKKVKSRKHK